MKLIAHRGASKEKQENTLEGLLFASELGAYAVECDIRRTGDNRYILFHDDTIDRMTGREGAVDKLSESEIREALRESGKTLTTLQDVLDGYRGKAAVLFDIGNRDFQNRLLWDADDDFMKMLAGAHFHAIAGIHTVDEARIAARYFAPEDILSFTGYEDAAECFRAGAKNIRLWENWLPTITPDDVRKQCEGADVWIMANREGSGSDGTPDTLRLAEELHADGILLNDIRMAIRAYTA